MKDDSVRELLTKHLPMPPPELTEPPLAAVRRRARRRTGAQMSAVVAAVAVIATGTVVVAGDSSTGNTSATVGASPTSSPTETRVSTGMLYPSYLPPGYREDSSGSHNSDSELRFLNPAADPPIPLVVRRLPEAARFPAEGPPLASPTVRGRAAEVLPIGNGGMALTWLESGGRFSISFEVPPDMQIDFVPGPTVEKLVSVAEGLRPGR